MRRLLAIVAAAALVLSSGAASAWDWTRQAITEARASIETPLVLVKDPRPADAAPTALHSWAARDSARSLTYTMTMTDISSAPSVMAMPKQDVAEGLLRVFAESWTITSKRTIPVPDGAGLEITADMDRGGVLRMRLVVKNNRIITMGMLTQSANRELLTGADADRYLTSLRFDQNP